MVGDPVIGFQGKVADIAEARPGIGPPCILIQKAPLRSSGHDRCDAHVSPHFVQGLAEPLIPRFALRVGRYAERQSIGAKS